MTTEGHPIVDLHLDDLTRQLLDALPISVIVESPTAEIRYWNRASSAIYGWAAEEAVGRSALDLGIAATDQQVAVDILTALLAGETWLGEFPVRTRTGQSLIASVTAVPLVRDGKTVAIVAASSDVTQRRLLDETFGLLDTLMTSAPVGLAFFDTEMRYVRVNAALAEMNGLPPEAHIGRRIGEVLPDADAAITALLATALAGDGPICDIEVTGVTPARPGVPRTWLSSWYPLRGPAGKAAGAGLVVVEITERKRGEAERERLLAAERAARAAAERAQDRLALLAEAGARLASSLDPETTLTNIAQLIVPRLADICVVDLLEVDALRRAAVVVADEHRQASLAAALRALPPILDGDQPVAAVLRTGRPMLIPSVPRHDVGLTGDARAEVAAQLAGTSAIVVPLLARGRVLGTLSFVSRPGGTPYGEEDVAVSLEIARRAAVALDNARLYAAEHRIADALQRSLLPAEPLVAPGGQVAVRYLSAEADAQVGGDFYDLVVVEGHPWTTAVGDVGGKGVRAAAVMGQLRAAVRAYALEGHEPAGVVRRLDRLFGVMDASDFTTCLVASYDPQTRILTWANAGHLPALIRRADGRCQWLRGPTALPLGLGDFGRSAQETESLRRGDLLVLYTDGLVERRDESIDVGLDRLRQAAGAAPADPERFCDDVLQALLSAGRRRDDVALLVFRAD